MLKKTTTTRHFVIPFDINYLPKALVTYSSLSQFHNNFIFHAFCFDNLTYEVIKNLKYQNFIPYKPSDFENKELLKAKNQKTKMYEYYWSCKAYLVEKVMDEQNADIVTYIDCDFMFFDTPEYIFDEMEKADVLIQPNNFSAEEAKQFIPVGYYCTCFESFRNNQNGRNILKWWHKKCMDWCYAEFKDGLFADQKYLDDWRLRFSNVREITTVGANITPWNVQKYDISVKQKKIHVNRWPLVYYHFHSFKMNLINYSYQITGDRENYYRISNEVKIIIYPPYIKSLKDAIRKLKKDLSYLVYAENNPDSTIKMAKKSKKIHFSSYKKAIE